MAIDKGRDEVRTCCPECKSLQCFTALDDLCCDISTTGDTPASQQFARDVAEYKQRCGPVACPAVPCRVAPSNVLHAQPAHPYTALLLAAVPEPDPRAEIPADEIQGELPSPLAPPSGCRFRTRCPFADETCAAVEPELREVDDGHFVACHHPLVEARAAAAAG